MTRISLSSPQLDWFDHAMGRLEGLLTRLRTADLKGVEVNDTELALLMDLLEDEIRWTRCDLTIMQGLLTTLQGKTRDPF